VAGLGDDLQALVDELEGCGQAADGLALGGDGHRLRGLGLDSAGGAVGDLGQVDEGAAAQLRELHLFRRRAADVPERQAVQRLFDLKTGLGEHRAPLVGVEHRLDGVGQHRVEAAAQAAT